MAWAMVGRVEKGGPLGRLANASNFAGASTSVNVRAPGVPYCDSAGAESLNAILYGADARGAAISSCGQEIQAISAVMSRVRRVGQ